MGRRLVYRFGRNSHGWQKNSPPVKSCLPTNFSALRPRSPPQAARETVQHSAAASTSATEFARNSSQNISQTNSASVSLQTVPNVLQSAALQDSDQIGQNLFQL